MVRVNSTSFRSEFKVFLEGLSQCFLTGNVREWLALVQAPLLVVTDTKTLVLKDEVDIIGIFLSYRLSISTRNIDLIARRPIEIEVCEDGAILCSFETSIFSKGHRLHKAWESSALLRKGTKSFRASTLLNVPSPEELISGDFNLDPIAPEKKPEKELWH